MSNTFNKHWLDYATAVFALIAAGGSISSVVVGWWQWDILRVQLQAMQTDQRPWVRIEIASIDSLIVSDKGIQFGVVFKFKNFGKSPATNVSYHNFLVPGGTTHIDEQKLNCYASEELTKTLNNTLTIFPNEDGNKVFNSRFNFQDPHALDVDWGQVKATDGVLWIVPVIVGCITYKTFIDNTIHHTRFALHFQKKSANGDGVEPIITGQQQINGNALTVASSSFGLNNAD
jgi:hypothetical protein